MKVAVQHVMGQERHTILKLAVDVGTVMVLAIFMYWRKAVSRFFVQAEKGVGPGGDIIFRRAHKEYSWYHVYLDDEKIGMVMENGARSRIRWTGLSYAKDSIWFVPRSMEGFADRMSAATFIIKHHGYWMRDERSHIKDEIRAEKFLTKYRMRKVLEIMKGHRAI
jgi:hypothetical protein